MNGRVCKCDPVKLYCDRVDIFVICGHAENVHNFNLGLLDQNMKVNMKPAHCLLVQSLVSLFGVSMVYVSVSAGFLWVMQTEDLVH